MHKLEFIQENESHVIHWDFEIQNGAPNPS